MSRQNKEELRKSYLSCCYFELKLLKPGNVNKISQIKGMSKLKFERAADISSKVLIQESKLSSSIYLSVKKCLLELNSNYNLGIILLCAPIIKASLGRKKNITELRNSLKKELKLLEEENSFKIFKAIIDSKPGGLKNFNKPGNLNKFSKNKFDFWNLMRHGSKHDRISRSYCDLYKEIFEQGLPYFKKLKKKFTYKYSAECLYIFFLSIDKDSHIQRKFGESAASIITKKAYFILKKISAKETELSNNILLSFDNYLKRKHVNPGTCADLTVTTLLIDKITDIVYNSN